MAIDATARVHRGGLCSPSLHERDGARRRKGHTARDYLTLSSKAQAASKSQTLDMVVEGVEIGEQMPVKVRKSGFTVRGTATVNKMNADGSEFEIHIRDRVWGRKVEKDVSVAVEKKPEGGYALKMDFDGEVSQEDVAQIKVEGQTTKLVVPDAKKGRMTEIQFTEFGEGKFRIRGEDFTADFNA